MYYKHAVCVNKEQKINPAGVTLRLQVDQFRKSFTIRVVSLNF